MKMKRCRTCGIYTLKETCPNCGRPTTSPHPPRFSPLDPYGKYRRMLKKQVFGGQL
ncbi:MAG: RNA-protein complex protein Nop10 [Hadesarchaea archaeon]|nr:MAG: RNA-protein complex protein Nop10 [Hadesarchaea archaeon]